MKNAHREQRGMSERFWLSMAAWGLGRRRIDPPKPAWARLFAKGPVTVAVVFVVIVVILACGGCVSLKTHRKAVALAEMRGRLVGQDDVMPIAERCIGELEKAAIRLEDISDGLSALGDEVAKETDKAVVPPPTYKKIIPSEWGTTPLRMKASPPSRPESYVEQFIRERKEAEQRLKK